MWIVFEPILFFLLQKEKKAGHAKPEALPVPHAILLMALISLPANTAKAKTSIRRKSRARLWSMESPENHPKGSLVVSFFSWRCDTVLFFLRIEKEKNGVAKFVSFSEGGKEMVSRKMQAANGFPYDEHSKCTTKSRPAL